MSQGRLSLVKKFRLGPEEAAELAEKAEKMNMTEAKYLRFMISQKPTDYPEMRILLRELINEVNHIGSNINQIVHNNNSGLYSEMDKEQLVRDIAVELQFDPETWRDDAEGKRLRYEAYAKRFLERFMEAA